MLLPAGVHLLPFLRPEDGAQAIVVCNAAGEAIIGPEYIPPAADMLDYAALLLERANKNTDRPVVSPAAETAANRWMQRVELHVEPPSTNHNRTREIL